MRLSCRPFNSTSIGRQNKINVVFVFQAKETWIHEFFCIARKGQDRVPSRAEKFELQAGRLGRRKICFHSKVKFSEFCQKLEEEFPKLKSADGFVLLRTGQQGNNGSLVTITPPSRGYSVAFLRDCSGLGQATAYIRALQRDLTSLSKRIAFALLVTSSWSSSWPSSSLLFLRSSSAILLHSVLELVIISIN